MTESMKQKSLHSCCFCEKDGKEVSKLIAGSTAFICDECVDICSKIIAGEKDHQEALQLQEELIAQPRKMLDVPLSEGVFEDIMRRIYRQHRFNPPVRRLLKQFIRAFARHIIVTRSSLDSKILDFQRQRQDIT